MAEQKQSDRKDVCHQSLQPAYLTIVHSCSQVTPALPTEGPNNHLTLVKSFWRGIWHPDLYLLAQKQSRKTPT